MKIKILLAISLLAIITVSLSSLLFIANANENQTDEMQQQNIITPNNQTTQKLTPKPIILDTLPAIQVVEKKPVSSFTTYHPCCMGRVHNIQLIADLLNDYEVFPGQTFSINKVVGARTLEKGFVKGGSIMSGEIIETVGGGISQFATTLFNAVFWAGLQIDEHHPHSMEFSRYPAGIEATLSWPYLDLKFTNDTKYPVKIRTSYTDTSITVILFGENFGREVAGTHKDGLTNIEVLTPGAENSRVVEANVSEPFNIKKSDKILVYPDASIEKTDLKVSQNGLDGKSLKVNRLVTEGKNIIHDNKWLVTYQPTPTEILVHPCTLVPEKRIHPLGKYDYSELVCE